MVPVDQREKRLMNRWDMHKMYLNVHKPQSYTSGVLITSQMKIYQSWNAVF